MTDDPNIAWFRADTRRMTAFDDLAGRLGQSLETAIIDIGDGPVAAVRYLGGGDPVAVIFPDGRVEEL